MRQKIINIMYHQYHIENNFYTNDYKDGPKNTNIFFEVNVKKSLQK